jgi:hypothetical protein
MKAATDRYVRHALAGNENARARIIFDFRGAPRYSEAVKRREFWDQGTRPSWIKGVCNVVLKATPNKKENGRKIYECQNCFKYAPKKAEAEAAGEKLWITIDHSTAWAEYIWKTAKPEADGRISMRSARMAYNDIDNLRAYCNSCNSSKNGYIP